MDIQVNVKKDNSLKIVMQISTVIGTILLCVFLYYAINSQIFTSQEKLSEFLKMIGVWGPVLFLVIQIIQVIIPIIPGGVSCAVGVLVFGPFWGFIYNYISIVLGSILVFMISKKYGMPLIKKMFKQKTIDKYIGWLDKGTKFEKFFAIAILLPISPDDFLCYLAGITKMTIKKFVAILVICKPITILAYSMSLVFLSSFFLK
ncbi:MAG: TVP38/TMEM64 family protein [Clostridia bacterium]|nr:TVP38/TMEM64 family protein [Clostridia bacterium]